MAKSSKSKKQSESEAASENQEDQTEGAKASEKGGEAEEVDQEEALGSAENALSALGEKLQESLDRELRARAEADNIQRRAAREIENARKFGVERLIRDLVPVVDSLERAVEMARASEEDGSDPEGIELATKLLFDVLSRHGVERIFPEGEPFDPEWHEAVAMAPNDECEENSVLTVVQAGLSLNGRLVRAAKVVVSRASE